MTTTNDTDQFALAHSADVFSDGRTYGLGCRAVCSCGWTGDWRDDTATAVGDGEDHTTVAVGPGDGLDATISGLLDLQDDLADAVMWLAEHWSADLPAPTQFGTGHPAAVVLLAYCADESELIRSAELVRAEPVDDPRPDGTGSRYRRATRDFGRVSLQAYRRLDEMCGECGVTFTEDLCPRCRTLDAAAA